jgi:branched-chain amino acid transport system substrate-binding protein
VKTRLILGAVLGALIFGVIGCSGGDTAGKTDTAGATGTTTTGTTGEPPKEVNIHDPAGYKIGVVASMTGDQKPWGEDCKKGAELAAEEFLQAGGVGDGKGINVDTQDDASKPEQGKSASQKLIGDGALALVGEVASGITMQMEQAAEGAAVPVIAVGATRTDLTKGHTNLVRVCYTDAFQGPVMAKFAYEELGLRKVALITDKKLPYSTGLSDAFRAYFTKLGGKIVDEQFYEQGTTQFQGLLTNLKAKIPDGLFMSGYFPETGPLAKQAKEAGLNVKMMGGDGWDSNEILKTGGEAIVDQYFCNHYNNNEDRPEVKNFLDRWAKKYDGTKPATTMGALGYDAMMLTLQALKKATTKDKAGLLAAINDTVDFPGVSGKITLKGMNGDPPKRAIVVQLKNDPANPQLFVKAYEMDLTTKEPVESK